MTDEKLLPITMSDIFQGIELVVINKLSNAINVFQERTLKEYRSSLGHDGELPKELYRYVRNTALRNCAWEIYCGRRPTGFSFVDTPERGTVARLQYDRIMREKRKREKSVAKP